MKNKDQIDKKENAEKQRRVWTALAMANVYKERARRLQQENAMLAKRNPDTGSRRERLNMLSEENQLFGGVLNGLESSLERHSKLISDLMRRADGYPRHTEAETTAKEPDSLPEAKKLPARSGLLILYAFCLAATLLFLRALCINIILPKL